jgi:dTDP-glucose 4,6-dehydratase
VRSFVRTYNFPATITRSSNNYGPYQFPEKFLSLMISNALEDIAVPVYGDGAQERDWLHVEDNCRAIYAVLQRGRAGEVYNIGTEQVQRNLDMAKRILRILKKPEALIAHVTDRPGHDRRYALNCSKIRQELGWQPSIPLQQGLEETVEWYRSNSKWLETTRSATTAVHY